MYMCCCRILKHINNKFDEQVSVEKFDELSAVEEKVVIFFEI